MKRLFALALVLSMLLSMVPAVFAAETESTVTVNLTGKTEVALEETALTYTVNVSGAQALATATLTFDVSGLKNPVAEGLNGWFILDQEYANGILTAVICNTVGVTGEAEILTVSGNTSGKPGTAAVALTEAVLSAYVGENSEEYATVIMGDTEVVTTIHYSCYDVNRDGMVNQLDITRAQRAYGAKAGDSHWNALADVDSDGDVDVTDLVLILNNYTVLTVSDAAFIEYLHGEFDDPEIEYSPDVRWWMAEGSHTDETLKEEIGYIAESGFGAVEFLAMTSDAADKNYGWGSQEWIDDTKLIIEEATKNGLGFALTSGTNWANANLPDTYEYEGQLIGPDHPSTGKQLTNASATVAAGQKLEAALNHNDYSSRGVTKYELVSVVAVGMVDAKNLNSQDTHVLVAGEDYTATETGVQVNWTAPENSENYVVYAFWMHGTGSISSPSYSKNYVLNYVDAAGMEALMAYWEANILTDELRALIKENGRGELYMDSLEVSGIGRAGGMLWGAEFLEEFEARRGYSFEPYMPFVLNSTSGSTFLFGDMSYTYNNFNADGRADDAMVNRIRNDYNQTMTELYMENVLQPLQEWLHEIGMTLRAEVSYGGHFYENTQPTKFVDGIETESLEFAYQIDSYRNFSGAAHLYNKVLSCEMGAALGMLYNGTIDRMNQIMYTGFASGISRNVLHTWSSQWGPSERNAAWPGFYGSSWPERVGYRQPLYQQYGEWTDMLSRYQKALRQGTPRMDVAILRSDYLIHNAVMAQGFGDTKGFRVGDSLYYDISLQHAGYTYDYFSPMLLTDPEVSFANGVIQPDGPGYQALIIYQEELPLEAAKVVLEWAKQGLPVILANGVDDLCTPNVYHDDVASTALFSQAGTDVDAELAAIMAELRKLDNVTELDDVKETVGALEALGVEPRVKFAEPNETLLTYSRQDAENDVNYLYVYNYLYGESVMREDTAIREAFTGELIIEGEGKPYVIDAWTGEVEAVETYRTENGKTILTVTMVPGEAALYAINTAENNVLHAVESNMEVVSEDGQLFVKATETGDYNTKLNNGRNVRGTVSVPADIALNWNVKIEAWTKGELITRTEEKYADHTTTEYKFDTVKTMKELGAVEELKAWRDLGVNESGVGYYTANFQLPEGWNDANGAILTLGSIYRSSAVIYVNGTRVAIPLETLKVDITDYLVEGENEIIVEVISNLENSYRGKPNQTYGLVGECYLDTYTLQAIA